MRKITVLIAIIVLAAGFSTAADAAVRLTTLSGASAEGRILADAVKILLEENLDVQVKHLPNFTADLVMHSAMISGEADFYVSYTGTQFTGVLGMDVSDEWKDREKILDFVREQFNERFDVAWLDPFGFNNTYALAVRREFAEEHGLEAMSDLRGIAPEMTLGMASIFRERLGDGYAAMNSAYGLAWGRPVGMDYGLLYRAAAAGDVDAVVGHSTDGRIAAMDLVILEDDLAFFPPYDCCLVITNALLEQFPEIPEIVAPLIGAIDEETMGYYNRLIDVEHLDFMEVAQMLVNDLAR